MSRATHETDQSSDSSEPQMLNQGEEPMFLGHCVGISFRLRQNTRSKQAVGPLGPLLAIEIGLT
jgi:hypothetical protein